MLENGAHQVEAEDELIRAVKRKLPEDHLVTSPRRWLEIGEIMTRRVVTIGPRRDVYVAAKRMAENNVSCILVTEDGQLLGIATETDLLRRMADRKDLYLTPIGRIMTRPVITAEAETSILDACRLIEEHGIKRLVVLRNGRLAGIITQTDLAQALTSHGMAHDLGDVMTHDVTTVTPKTCVHDAVVLMTQRNISCVVVVDADRIIGMFTERDLLARVIAERKDPKQTLIADVMTRPVITVPRSYSVFSASRAMIFNRVRRLVVTEHDRLAGIVTQTDLLDAIYHDFQREEQARQEALDTSESSVFTLDPQGRITYVNPTTARLLGVDDRDELIDRPFLDERFWWDPSDRRWFEQFLGKQDLEPIELHLRSGRGRHLYVMLFLVPVRHSDGRVKGYHGTLHDVTREKLATRELERNYAAQSAFNEMLAKSLEDLSLKGVLQHFLERIVSVPWLMLQDRGLIALAEEPGGDLVIRAHHNLDPETLKQCQRIKTGHCLCGRAAASGKMLFAERVDERHEVHCRNMQDHGHYCLPILSPTWGVLGVMTLYTRAGHERDPAEETFLLSVSGLLSGVLERYETQKQIQSLARFPGEDPAPVLRVAGDGTILYANEAAVPVLELWDRRIGQACPPDLLELIRGVMERRESARIDVTVDDHIYELCCVPLAAEGYVNLYGRDMTEERRAGRELRRLNQAMTETVEKLEMANLELHDFAKVVAHDLKAPVRAIGTLAQWIAADHADKLGPDGAEQLALLIGRTERLNRLLDSVIQYSCIGRVESTKEELDLNALVTDLCNSMEIPPHIIVEIENDLGTVLGHRLRITQVFQNLIGNAVKYMDKPKGQIRITRRELDQAYRFEVIDNGPGIEPNQCDRIFQVFQTLEPRDEIEGAGVGLALVKKIIEDMYEGHVGVEAAVGTGSTFWFTLPKIHFPAMACPVTIEAEE